MPDKTKVPPGSLDHVKKPKWEIIYREPYGRCIVATQDIREGELLFKDFPAVVGPKQNSDFLCLGCYRQLDPMPDYFCSKCGMPMCGEGCENKGYHPLECSAFVKANYKVNLADFGESNPLYESILPLRCLLLKDVDEKKWATLEAMESHDELRKGSELWEIEQKNVCDFLREKINIQAGDDLLHRLTGVLDINCHEVKFSLPGSRLEGRVRGVYSLCAMMSHDCYSNTHHTFTDDLTMIMIASRDIKKGEQVTGTYTHLLSGTTERRKHIRYGKFFDCMCDRCADPTELGTYFSALRCTKNNCQGNVLCKDPLHPQNKADYACDKCKIEIAVGTVSRLTNLIYYELQGIGEGDPESLERIYSKYQPLLHPNHFHLIGIKHSLSQMYGRYPGYLIGDLTKSQMLRKIECCQHLLNILDVIDPGISRLRGMTQYELHAPLLVTANREFQQKMLTKQRFLSKLREALKLLEDSVYCLKFEPLNTHEGEVCEIARNSTTELKQWMATVERLPATHFLDDNDELNLDDDDAKVRRIQEELSLEALIKEVAGLP